MRVLVVDDYPGFRKLARLLLTAGGYSVVGEAAERLVGLPAQPVVVMVSGRTRAELGRRLDAAPVRGFLPKDQLTLEAFAALTG